MKTKSSDTLVASESGKNKICLRKIQKRDLIVNNKYKNSRYLKTYVLALTYILFSKYFRHYCSSTNSRQHRLKEPPFFYLFFKSDKSGARVGKEQD